MTFNQHSAVLTLALTQGIAFSAQATAAEHGKTDQERPNILFVIADDASYYHFGANGCSWTNTPAFDEISENGLNFSRCYTSNAKSAPSRSSIITGRYFYDMGAATNHNPYFPSELNVFPEVLKENGYRTGYTGKGWAPGEPGERDGKPRELTGKCYNKYKKKAPTKGIHNVDYARNFSAFMNEDNGQPWFFWFGCYEPHRKYEYGSAARLAGRTTDEIDFVPRFWPDNDTVRNDMLDYGFEIEYFDQHLGLILQDLKKRGQLDNTLIIVTADNGMPFPRCKGNNYEYSHHEPLVMMWKDKIIKPGRHINDIVNFIDFAPTILEAAQVNSDLLYENLPGHTLSEYFKGKSTVRKAYREYTVIGRERHDYGRPGNQGYPIRGIIEGNLLYIANLSHNLYPAGNPETGYTDCDGSPTKTQILQLERTGTDSQTYNLCFNFRPEEELYNLDTDPECLINLSEQAGYQEIKAELKDRLFKELRANEDPRIMGNGSIFDNYPYCKKVGVDFWENVMNKSIPSPWKITQWINPTDYSTYPR